MTIGDYLIDRGYRKVAIHGYGFLGKQLLGRLRNCELEVSYVLDRNAKYLDCEVPILTIDDSLPSVDAVIVTMIDGEKDVVDKLQIIVGVDVITLRGVLEGM